MASFNQPGVNDAVELPQIAGQTKQQEARAQIPPNSPFYYAWHPRRWHVMGDKVVPQLRPIKLRPGTNGCDVTRGGLPVPMIAVAAAEMSGWTIIPWDVDGEGTSYLYQVQGVWLDRSERLYPGAIQSDTDTPRYTAWVRSLVDRGIVDQPNFTILSQLQEKYRDEVRRQSGTNPEMAREAAEKRDIVKAYIADLRANAASLPETPGLPQLGTAAEAVDPVKPKRKRRTKAEMAAARAAEAEPVEELTVE